MSNSYIWFGAFANLIIGYLHPPSRFTTLKCDVTVLLRMNFKEIFIAVPSKVNSSW